MDEYHPAAIASTEVAPSPSPDGPAPDVTLIEIFDILDDINRLTILYVNQLLIISECLKKMRDHMGSQEEGSK